MICFKEVTFSYPQKDLYNKISFEIREGDHAVLIGSNGTGKSTLLNLILDRDSYTYEGIIKIDENIRIGMVSQFVNHEESTITSYEYLAEPFTELQRQNDAICEEMGTAEDMDEVYGRYQKILDEMDALDAYNYAANIGKQLALAGLSEIADVPVNAISGGEYKMLSIIRNMLLKPQLLIMDEPDVFLDFENSIGLMKLINAYQGTILVITHNRLLLNQCFNKILHIENEELQEFPGSFAEYNAAMLDTKINMQENAAKFDDFIQIQEKVIERIRAAATNTPNPKSGNQLKARVSYLERLKVKRGKNPFIEEHPYQFRFPEIDEEKKNGTPQTAIAVEGYSLCYDRPILTDVSFTIKEGEKVAVVGANGTGKSSLLQDVYEMTKKVDPERVGFFRQIYDEDGAEQLSGGERNLRQLYALADSKAEILFLDEPTSHLDMYAQIALEEAIRAYEGTVLLVSHDFFTVTNCADRILILENGTIREMSGRAYRKSIYKKYFSSDIFEQEKLRKEKEVQIHALLKEGKHEEARAVFEKNK
ncbi:MAG: ATP-binding cassette domain-containing protein [Eubacteriales bacterium]|nr:ATP-binding cassette domain-containing protein [Eubacteriales bacterium]